jgi:hypothetical protein
LGLRKVNAGLLLRIKQAFSLFLTDRRYAGVSDRAHPSAPAGT